MPALADTLNLLKMPEGRSGMKPKTEIKKSLHVVGDRVLIRPEEAREKTSHGLYLPQGVEVKEKIQRGMVVKVGPGYPMPLPGSESDEPWSGQGGEPKYLPLQVEPGDYALFLRKSAIEITFEDEEYLIVPHSAILLVVRDDLLDQIKTSGEADE